MRSAASSARMETLSQSPEPAHVRSRATPSLTPRPRIPVESAVESSAPAAESLAYGGSWSILTATSPRLVRTGPANTSGRHPTARARAGRRVDSRLPTHRDPVPDDLGADVETGGLRRGARAQRPAVEPQPEGHPRACPEPPQLFERLPSPCVEERPGEHEPHSVSRPGWNGGGGAALRGRGRGSEEGHSHDQRRPRTSPTGGAPSRGRGPPTGATHPTRSACTAAGAGARARSRRHRRPPRARTPRARNASRPSAGRSPRRWPGPAPTGGG